MSNHFDECDLREIAARHAIAAAMFVPFAIVRLQLCHANRDSLFQPLSGGGGMSEKARRGISRQGLDAAFEEEETRKSNLLLEAQLLLAKQQPDEAAAKFAEAAEIEALSAVCEVKGLMEKAWVHRFSAVSCWVSAGNLHAAIVLGDQMLASPDLPARLRQGVYEFIQAARRRRAHWSAEPVLSPTSAAR